MSDVWRQKRYYRPRVILSTSDVLDNPFPGRLVYLSGAETSLIRNLLAYAHRRVTFASDYQASFYLTPTPEEWDSVQAFVAQLEDTLMTDCCDTLNETLEAIAATLETMGVNIGGIDTSLAAMDTKVGSIDASLASMDTTIGTIGATMDDVVTAVECICGRLELAALGTSVDPKWTDNPDNLDFWKWGNDEPDPTVPSKEETAACQLAQLWYQAGYELLSEVILPSLRFGFDTVIPAAAALIATWTGGLALPVAIGVYATAELIQELLELGYDSAETNLLNWLWANKQDLVCPMFHALQDGGTASSMWPSIWADVVEPSGDISYGDKLLVRLFMGGMALSGAQVAFDAATTWATTIPTPGYCSTCPGTGEETWIYTFPPCPGDWVGDFECWEGRLCGYHGKGMQVQVMLPSPPSGQYNEITWDLEFYSIRDAGFGVGDIQAYYYDAPSWYPMTDAQGIGTNTDPPNLNVRQYVQTGFTEPGGRMILFQLYGPGGQYETQPYPIELTRVQATLKVT